MLLSVGRLMRLEFDLSARVRPAIARLAEMRQAAAGRRAIARMDARVLSDIGLSHGQAQEEVSRRPWDTAQRF